MHSQSWYSSKFHRNTMSLRAKVTICEGFPWHHVLHTHTKKKTGKKNKIVSCLNKQYIEYVLELIFSGYVRSPGHEYTRSICKYYRNMAVVL